MQQVKWILKFLLLVIVTTILFAVVSALLPYSNAFKSASQQAPPSVLGFLLLANAWTCFVIIYIVQQSGWKPLKLLAGLTLTLFFVHAIMTQIETYFFHSAFPLLSTGDIFLITLANAVPIVTGVPLAIWLFKRKENAVEREPAIIPGIRALIPKLFLIGLAYVIVYFTFGYFVAWQVHELRTFYSGDAIDEGFIGSLITNYREHPGIFPFQFLRGVLFGLFLLPLVRMFKDRSAILLISLILVLSATGAGLIIPNFLFPDVVRRAHFVEVTSSMAVFAVVIWWVFDRLDSRKKLAPEKYDTTTREVDD